MKVAVCISGTIRSLPIECLESILYHFKQFDLFFGVWENEDLIFRKTFHKYINNNNVFLIPEPRIRYNCKTDTCQEIIHPSTNNKVLSKKDQIWKGNKINTGAIRQFIAHGHVLSKLDSSYDMIIRLRYDVLLSKEVNFIPLLEQSYNDKAAYGFATIFNHDKHKKISELNYLLKETLCKREEGLELPSFLYDFMIFHKRELFDVGCMNYLIDRKLLHCNEIGWYQLLSHPYESNHVNYHGGVQLSRKGL